MKKYIVPETELLDIQVGRTICGTSDYVNSSFEQFEDPQDLWS